MKKIRLLLSIAMVSLALGACSSSPLGVDDEPTCSTIEACALHNPNVGHNPNIG